MTPYMKTIFQQKKKTEISTKNYDFYLYPHFLDPFLGPF